jgi:hypothetical protein
MISAGNNIDARGGVDGICDGFPPHAGINACNIDLAAVTATLMTPLKTTAVTPNERTAALK